MDDSLADRLTAPPERQDELLETDHLHTLADIVDVHSDHAYDLNVTTRGLDTADLVRDDELDDVVGFPGNYSNDGMAGDRVDDALAPDFDEPESMMAGEYGPSDSDLESDMMDNLDTADEQSTPLDDQAALSGGLGAIRHGISAPTGFQIETPDDLRDQSQLLPDDSPKSPPGLAR